MEQPNLNYISELSGNDLEFRSTLIEIVKKELPIEIEFYQKSIESDNFFNAAQAVHKLKHKISILGLEKSYYIAEDFENNLNNNSKTLQDEFEAILESMIRFVNNL